MLPREGLRLLSKISSVPSLAFQALWPWTLVEEIIKALYQNPALEGLRNSQTSSGYPQNFILRPTHLDMVDFSFWLAAEIPMGEKERLELLQKSCTVERLLFIRNILQSTEPVAFVRCVHCNSNIARVSDIFTVDRAHGTNGAYVNPHGIIHQTWTVRQVCEDSTLITGSPETKDR
jgi:cereblon